MFLVVLRFLYVFVFCSRVRFRCFWFGFRLSLVAFFVFEAARRKAHILIPSQKPLNSNDFDEFSTDFD